MNWGIWDRLEGILVDAGIRPIVAVIPDNTDAGLFIDPPNETFWDRVRSWQRRGWSIAMHGCHHRYVNDDRGIVGSRWGTEFAGLPFDEQDAAIERGLGIFANEGVTADAWIAPNHSFDRTTLAVLEERGPSVVVDGFSLFPYREAGITWVPQQLWGLRRRPFGVWTVCMHPNRWTQDRLDAFVHASRSFGRRITDLPSVLARYGARRRGTLDHAYQRWAWRDRPSEPTAGPARTGPSEISPSIERQR